MDVRLLIGGAVGGTLVGLTGIGGGALLTPFLILLGIPPATAVGSDLMVSLVMKPVGGFVHLRAGTVRLDIVKALAIGSVPGALAGALIAGQMAEGSQAALKTALGAVLVAAALSNLWRLVKRQRRLNAERRNQSGAAVLQADALTSPVRPLPTLLLGAAGGLAVGLTSVGSGSLMLVVLAALYPALSPGEMVGTDLTQAIPLVAAAALGHLILGNVKFGITGPLLIGALPGVYLGAHLSAGRAVEVVRWALPPLLLAAGTKLVIGS